MIFAFDCVSCEWVLRVKRLGKAWFYCLYWNMPSSLVWAKHVVSLMWRDLPFTSVIIVMKRKGVQDYIERNQLPIIIHEKQHNPSSTRFWNCVSCTNWVPYESCIIWSGIMIFKSQNQRYRVSYVHITYHVCQRLLQNARCILNVMPNLCLDIMFR